MIIQYWRGILKIQSRVKKHACICTKEDFIKYLYFRNFYMKFYSLTDYLIISEKQFNIVWFYTILGILLYMIRHLIPRPWKYGHKILFLLYYSVLQYTKEFCLILFDQPNTKIHFYECLKDRSIYTFHVYVHLWVCKKYFIFVQNCLHVQ